MNSGREKEDKRDRIEVKKTKWADAESGLKRHKEGHSGAVGGMLTVSMCCV